MKKIIALLLIINVFNCGFGQTSAWREIFYNNFDYTNFTTYSYFADTINPDNFDFALLNAAVFYETNRQRVKHGRKPLKHHPKLEVSAQGHSKDMVALNFYSHTSRVPGKTSVSNRVKKAGLNGEYVGENIYDHYILNFDGKSYCPPSQCGYFKYAGTGKIIFTHTYYTLAKKLVDGWMNSPGHRTNILNSNYTHMGMGNYAYYKGAGIDKIPNVKSTQNFARIETTFASSFRSTGSKYSAAPKPTAFCIIAGAAGVFNSFEDMASADGHLQAALYLGVLKGRKGYGQNFYGMFSSLDLGNGNPLTIEAGTILRRFYRLSAGLHYGPDTEKNAQAFKLVPSVTTGFRINISNIFIDLNLNAYGNYRHHETRIISAIGLWF